MGVTDLNHVEKANSKTVEDKTCRLLPLALILLGLVSLLFAAVPGLDLTVSRLFWDPVTGFVKNSFLIAFRDAKELFLHLWRGG